MTADDPRAIFSRRLRPPEDPRRAEGGAPDHDGRTAGGLDHGPRVGEAPHVAVADHRDRDRVDDARDDLPRRPPAVLLRPRARADGDPVDAFPSRDAGDLDGIDGPVVPAAADLDRE